MSHKDTYNHKEIERKWQGRWRETNFYHPDLENSSNKYYNLWMFPYPSAEGLHAGHAFASTGSDIAGRFHRMHGKNVFQPIGYDSFGIHTENFAIKIGDDPHVFSQRAFKNYERQLRALGHGYDWGRTVATSDVSYYKWTQWLFVEMFKAGLAYKKKASVNWCPSCKTVLSDEQVMTPAQAGKIPAGYNSIDEVPEGTKVCERCGTIVERKELEQWFFRITAYADRLLQNLDKITWTSKVKLAQKEWIGKSKGLSIDFKVKDLDITLTVWTKFWETVFGTTYLVLAPEHPAVEELSHRSGNRQEFMNQISVMLAKSEQQRKLDAGKKDGFFTGSYAINPVNGKEVPIWIADYVLWGVGTGAVMGVPAHDKRDFDFAKKYGLDIVQVVSYEDKEIDQKVAKADIYYEGEGKLINSGKFEGLSAWGEGKTTIAEWMIDEGFANWETTYHLRDWLISRQRYWGPPIPMIYCSNCASEGNSWFSDNKPTIHTDQSDWDASGWYPANELPVVLPEIEDFKPEGTGKGPLANHPEFYKVTCPFCGGEAERETDVSDTFVDSSWYFLRYPSTDADSSNLMPFDKKITEDWLPVDLYFGGAEHSVLHLMYARFVTQVLHDLDYLSFEEPFPRFYAHGLMIKDGAKMSKSKGNVVNPDEYIEKFGADTLRLYLMFMGPMDGSPDFRDTGIEGMQRFVKRVWRLFEGINAEEKEDKNILVKMHQTIKKVTQDISDFSYNTALSAIMEYVNFLTEKKNYSKEYLRPLAQMLAPFAPHMTEEAWEKMGEKESIHVSSWPKYDESLTQVSTIVLPIQVNGKVRSQITIQASEMTNKEEILANAQKDPAIIKALGESRVVNQIYVPGKIINLVTK